jgi:hypothetical protein
MGNIIPYTKEESNDVFYTKKYINDSLYDKSTDDKLYAPSSIKDDMTGYYDKINTDALYAPTSVVDNYYNKDQFNSKFAPMSIEDSLTNNYYDKSTSDSKYAPISIQFNDIKDNLASNYYNTDNMNANFIVGSTLSNQLNNYYTGSAITSNFMDYNYYASAVMQTNYVIPPILNNYYLRQPNWYSIPPPPPGTLTAGDDIPNNTYLKTPTFNSNITKINSTTPMASTTQTLYDNVISNITLVSGVENNILNNTTISTDGFVTCHLNMNAMQSVDATVFLYYSDVSNGLRKVAGCSVKYQAADTPQYASSFSYPVRKNSIIKATVLCPGSASISSTASVHIVIAYQPMNFSNQNIFSYS